MRCAALLVIVGCASPAPLAIARARPVTRSAALGVPGEVIEYEVSLRGITVAKIVTAVGKAGIVDGHRAIIVKSRGTSTGLVAMAMDLTWELTTTLDIDRGVPLDAIEEATVVLPGGKTEHSKHHRTWGDGDDRHDVHSAAGVVRAWQTTGPNMHLDVKLDTFTIDASFHETTRERIAGHAMPTVRYDGDAVDGKYHFWLWVSDDTARVPIRLLANSKWGMLRIDLVSYDVPAD